jgi:hypothetical protein
MGRFYARTLCEVAFHYRGRFTRELLVEGYVSNTGAFREFVPGRLPTYR